MITTLRDDGRFLYFYPSSCSLLLAITWRDYGQLRFQGVRLLSVCAIQAFGHADINVFLTWSSVCHLPLRKRDLRVIQPIHEWLQLSQSEFNVVKAKENARCAYVAFHDNHVYPRNCPWSAQIQIDWDSRWAFSRPSCFPWKTNLGLKSPATTTIFIDCTLRIIWSKPR